MTGLFFRRFLASLSSDLRNFLTDQNSAELDKDLGELDKNSAELDRKNMTWLCELASVSWNTLKEYFSSFEISHYMHICLYEGNLDWPVIIASWKKKRKREK